MEYSLEYTEEFELHTDPVEPEIIESYEQATQQSQINPNSLQSQDSAVIVHDGWSSALTPIPITAFIGNSELHVEIPESEEMFLNLFLTKTIINYYINLTNKKIIEKNPNVNENNPNLLNQSDLFRYIAILLLLSIRDVPNASYCWQKSKTFSYCPLISKILKYKRFNEINNNLTCISQKDIISGKIIRIPKIIGYCKNLFCTLYTPGENLSLDEGMMAYKGKTRNRVYCPFKPDKWGIKFYIIAESSTSYVYNLRIVGVHSSLDSTVNELCANLCNANRVLFMDNFYNSFKLSEALLDKGIYICGTLRDRRGGPKNLKKLKQTTLRGHSLCLQKKNTSLLIWTDKKAVAVITTKFDITKYEKIKGKDIPLSILNYNKNMGGVDKFDQMIKYYSMKRKTNRWTQRFSIHILELLMHNSYLMYENYFTGKKLTHYEFFEKIIKYLLLQGGFDDRFGLETENQSRLHLPIKSEKESNCRFCYTQNERHTSFYKCEKCDVFLCIYPCFKKYHCTEDSESDEESIEDD
jgi:Transposase IS4